MGVSFKVSKTGRWFRPKPLQSESRREQDGMVIDDSGENQRTRGKIESGSRKQAEICQGDEDATGFCDGEVSFTLSLYPDGYTIGKPSEGESGHQNSIEVPKFLHPYDRASETLFSAIESGRLPGDILDDIHCKYINGMVFCEVRDYRKCFSETGGNMPSIDGSPIINKVCLRMSLENVVKDIPLISDSGWTYGDLMEVESRILKALQPKLSLDPTPMLDRQHDNPIPNKLNFALMQKANSFGSNASGPSSPLMAHPSKYPVGVGSPRIMQDHRSGSVLNTQGASIGQDMMIAYSENVNSGTLPFHVKKDSQEAQSPSLSVQNKRSRVGVDGNQQPHVGSQVEGFHGPEAQLAAKRRSNSHPKAPAMHVVGSPASVSNTSVPLNVSSPPVGTPVERFSKIDLVMSSSFRHRLNRKKNKVDELPMGKSRTFPVQELQRHLSTDSSNEIFKEDSSKVSLSKSLVGGNTNICKARVSTFMQSEHIIQGNNFSFVPKARTRLIMSMKRNDDTVAMQTILTLLP